MLEAAKTWYNSLCDEDQCDDFDAEEVLYHLHSPYSVYRYGTVCTLINWERMERNKNFVVALPILHPLDNLYVAHRILWQDPEYRHIVSHQF